jgi:NACalpha-BTF3-like transcription factor
MGEQVSKILEPCCTGSSNADNSTEAYPGSYQITLDRSSGMKLGLDVEEIPSANHLPIRGINGGLAAKWNETNSSKIQQGDRIVQVNGVANDVAAMMKKCRTDKVLKMVILPAGAASSTASVTVPTAALAGYAPTPAEPAYQRSAAPEPAEPAYQRSPAPAREPERPRDAPSSFVASGAAVDKMQELGIPEARAREALEIAGNDLTLALEVCGHNPAASGGGPPPPAASPPRPQAQGNEQVRTLVEMGFTEDQAKRALRESNGDIDAAMATLLGGESPGGGGGGSGGGQDNASREKLETLKGMGFPEDKCRQALNDANGDVEAATAMLLSD